MNLGSVKTDSAEGKEMLAKLENVSEGEWIRGGLMPAIPAELDWICVKRTGNKHWRLEARFCGIVFKLVEINVAGHLMIMTPFGG